MNDAAILKVTGVRLNAASTADAERGLLGWLAITIGDALVLDGVALRRTLEGRLTLSFPARRGRDGRQHHLLRPVDDAARRDLEAQVFARLGIGPEVQP